MPKSLAGEQIGILGLARSGLAAARLALARGARVYASDAGDSDASRQAAETVRSLGGDAETGGHDLTKLGASDRIVLSPGIPPTAKVLKEEAIGGIPVVPEIELAYEQLDCPVIAITGTNGKTTVTALIEHLMRGDGIDAVAGGNIGTALSEVALREPQPAWAIVECSSFQLGGIRHFNPKIGVLTNLAPDHLDWYPDLEAYYADKARMYVNASADSLWILNAEDERAATLLGDAPGTRLYFRAETPPDSEDELGGWVSSGTLVIRTEPGRTERVIPAAGLQILGPHNIANALAAALAARLAGASLEGIAEGLRTFQAPPHRLQPVADVDGVLWVNDSKATNIASTRVAVRGMTRPTVLLLGGKHKGEPYTELLPDLAGHVRAVIAYGEAAPLIVADLEGKAPVERVDGPFEDVVRRARERAHEGDAVLLSPACSSFDMFRNYEARGERFAQLAREGRAG
ncbi:UDP-N-acetylmuramoyl-L-alanine--D-glutamate ligase [Longimicrobium sp.]|uniref:UDP-N-acetylmuramoyl-L-alanine--D-glutamate ligase n=1 Tax=Longimicrobium sp. TaxID=2029185 RepID=UPI002E3812C9|nr:UDP-N-acetylmuramoyl-L-alanine--D-glutamate ligase [Longimicrobium sp.]HEX6037104.1 UDP-N-acetylmuramoyl-L-alanine--D-glutamate ligase [Longimicrobium sp.]